MMFREMRRFKQQLLDEESIHILDNNTSGVLSVIGDDGYPYGVPLSYAYDKGILYFHSAVNGHKIDAIRNNAKVSFCVIDRDDVHPSEFTTYYRSVIAFGKARIIDVNEEKQEALDLLSDKYSKGDGDKEKEIANGINRLVIIEVRIEHLSGKCAKELRTV